MTTTRIEQPTPDYVPGHGLLRDQVVVVTAAAGAGIGAAVVRRALEEDAKAVVFSDTHERRLAEAEEALGQEFGAERVRQLVCDVTDEAQVEAAVAAVQGLRISVCCAGVGHAEKAAGKRGAHRLEPFERVIRVNLIGTFNVLSQFAAALHTADPIGEERGVVINTASVAAYDGQIGQAAYAVLHTGPSATADIEGVLIHGAQGVRSLTVPSGGTIGAPMIGVESTILVEHFAPASCRSSTSDSRSSVEARCAFTMNAKLPVTR